MTGVEAGDLGDFLDVFGIALRATAAVHMRVDVPRHEPAIAELDHSVCLVRYPTSRMAGGGASRVVGSADPRDPATLDHHLARDRPARANDPLAAEPHGYSPAAQVARGFSSRPAARQAAIAAP